MPISGTPTLHVAKRFCNIYGAGWDGGAKRVLGGIGPQKPAHQWNCENQELNRYFLECEHGHRGDITLICRTHYLQYQRKIQFCPRCNATDDHRCDVTIREVS